jgi:hypothetical protein
VDSSAALTALMSAMKQLGLVQQKAGQMTHSMDAMLLAASAQSVGLKTAFEVGKGSARELDLQVKRVGTVVANVETKSTQAKKIMAELNPAQLLQDARKVQQAGEDFINVWAFTRRSFSVANIGEIERRMEGLQDKIRADIAKTTGKTGAELQQAVETTMKSFHFVDKVGKLIQLEFDDGKLKAVVKPVSDHLLGPDGTFAQVLLAGAQGSPNLKPMAEVLLGPNGKFATAAHEAATGTNLNTAETDLQNKLSKTLSDGIEQGASKGTQEAIK